MLDDGFLEQFLEHDSTFSISDAPANNAAAEDVDDEIEYLKENFKVARAGAPA